MNIVTFTTGGKYDAYANKLKASADALGLNCFVSLQADQGSWTANLNLKPKIILDALNNSHEPVLFLDADSLIMKPITALESIYKNVSAYLSSPNKPCGGTLYFLNTERSKAIAKAWVEEVKANPDCADDYVNLVSAIKRFQGEKIGSLAPAYCWHEESMRRRFPTAEPIIQQFCVGEHNYRQY